MFMLLKNNGKITDSIMIMPSMIETHCCNPPKEIPFPIIPKIKPRMPYVMVRPTLYTMLLAMRSDQVLVFSGKAMAMGPHIPIQ